MRRLKVPQATDIAQYNCLLSGAVKRIKKQSTAIEKSLR